MPTDPLIIYAVCLVVLLIAGCGAVDYPIQLSRPYRAGDRWKLASRYVQRLSTNWGGQRDAQRSDELIEATGVAEILAVDQHGMPIRAACQIERCDQQSEPRTPGCLLPGQVLLAQGVGEGQTLTIDDEPITPEQRYVCGLLGLLDWESPYEDLLLGTTQRRRVGESWTAHMRAGAGRLAETVDDTKGLRVADVVGEFKLVAVTGDRGEECLEIEGHMRPLGLLAARAAPYAGMSAEPKHMAYSISGLWPLDTRLPVRRRTDSIKSGFLSTGVLPTGTPVTFDMETEMVRSVTFIEGRVQGARER